MVKVLFYELKKRKKPQCCSSWQRQNTEMTEKKAYRGHANEALERGGSLPSAPLHLDTSPDKMIDI